MFACAVFRCLVEAAAPVGGGESQWQDCVWYIYLVRFGAVKWPSHRKRCARAGRLVVQQVLEGEGVYKCRAVGNYYCVLEGCLFPLSL